MQPVFGDLMAEYEREMSIWHVLELEVLTREG